MSGSRVGFTLSELVVALGVGGVAFGAFALVVAQQERAHAELSRRVRARAQLRDGLAALVTDLRAASPAAGDIPPGGARDSSIELRATIGTAVACEVEGSTIVGALTSFVTPPGAGDTAWAYVERDGASGWAAFPISGVSVPSGLEPSACAFPAGALTVVHSRGAPGPTYSLTLAEQPPATAPSGTPFRVTRRVRYSLYRAPDGRWYLGRREWSQRQSRFETIQPVSGPYRGYATPSGDTSGLELRYFDGDDVELPAGLSDTERIARIAITLRAPPAPFDNRTWEPRDVASATVAMRNRP
ncbi:MAG: type II secretion system protein J [Gemmatimonadaceae bacterium]